MSAGVLVVTGASRGIGAAVARLGARHGYAIAVNYAVDEAGAAAVVASIKAEGGEAVAIRADIARETDVAQMFVTAERTLGKIAGLVNNAGVAGKTCRVDEIAAADLQRVLAVNVAGSFLCAREAVLRMATRHGGNGGAIVNISSIAARIGGANEWVHYAASKGAIDTFTVGLAREVAADGIRVNAISPGLIDTEIHAPGRLDRMRAGVPMQRIGTAEEVAEVALWLLSPAASYVTGTNVEVGGGR